MIVNSATRIASALLLVVFATVALVIGLPEPRGLSGHSVPAALVYIVIYAAATMLPVPKALFSLTAGVLFGPVGGLAVTLVGATVGATLAFLVARWLGRAPIQRIAGTHAARLDGVLDRHGLIAMIGLRLIPVVPFTALNYAAGLTRLTTGRYVLATTIGITPGAGAYVLLGAWGRHPGSWPLIASLVVLAVFCSLVAILIKSGRLDAWRAARRPVDG